jgi:dTMP kinase
VDSNTTILKNLVVLEGLDGSGTSTQLRLLDERMGREGMAHEVTWEPTEGRVGQLIREVLRGDVRAHPRTVALLFAADRSEHLWTPETGMAVRAGRGERVVCDRYLFSSLAYQSVTCGFDDVLALNRGFPLPQILVFLDTPVAVCQRRIAERGAREIYDDSPFQEKVRESYLSCIGFFRGSGMHTVIVDGNRSVEEIHRDIWMEIAELPTLSL